MKIFLFTKQDEFDNRRTIKTNWNFGSLRLLFLNRVNKTDHLSQVLLQNYNRITYLKIKVPVLHWSNQIEELNLN